LVLFVERHTLRVFAWYRIALGVIILIAAMFFNLSA
jgi:undecaprenyl-diphosphatase